MKNHSFGLLKILQWKTSSNEIVMDIEADPIEVNAEVINFVFIVLQLHSTLKCTSILLKPDLLTVDQNIKYHKPCEAIHSHIKYHNDPHKLAK